MENYEEKSIKYRYSTLFTLSTLPSTVFLSVSYPSNLWTCPALPKLEVSIDVSYITVFVEFIQFSIMYFFPFLILLNWSKNSPQDLFYLSVAFIVSIPYQYIRTGFIRVFFTVYSIVVSKNIEPSWMG